MSNYKSPIKKISHAGSKLASAAAHRGSQIIDQASSAVQNAVSSTTTLSPIIPRGQEDKDPTERPSRRSGAGIRDRINKFDSVAASRRGKYNQSPPSSDRTPHRVKYVATSFSRRSEEKREGRESFPCNPDYRPVNERIVRNTNENDKENERPMFRDKDTKRTSPPKPTPAKSVEIRPAHAKINDEEYELKKRLQELEEENEKLEKMNLRLVRKCEELTRVNARIETSSHRGDNDSKNNKHSRSGEMKHEKKRLIKEHPLISSPLRMHAMAVHEASESNSVVSVRKDPFPLFPPEQQPLSVCQADRSSGHKMAKGSCHLDTLGVLTCNIQKKEGIFGANVRQTDSVSDYNCEARENEDALDLLNSAAFLFKNSRRRLN